MDYEELNQKSVQKSAELAHWILTTFYYNVVPDFQCSNISLYLDGHPVWVCILISGLHKMIMMIGTVRLAMAILSKWESRDMVYCVTTTYHLPSFSSNITKVEAAYY